VSKVTVSGASYSSNGVSTGLTLSPGQSTTLDATFAPASAGNYSGSIAVASNATNSPDSISLSGSSSQAVSHSVSLTWAPSTSTVAGYHVYRSQVSGGPYAILDSSAVTADAYTDSNVLAGQTYYYVIKSVTQGGVESADSTQAAALIP
jgi:fibronectin type 3 domain-containing protein